MIKNRSYLIVRTPGQNVVSEIAMTRVTRTVTSENPGIEELLRLGKTVTITVEIDGCRLERAKKAIAKLKHAKAIETRTVEVWRLGTSFLAKRLSELPLPPGFIPAVRPCEYVWQLFDALKSRADFRRCDGLGRTSYRTWVNLLEANGLHLGYRLWDYDREDLQSLTYAPPVGFDRGRFCVMPVTGLTRGQQEFLATRFDELEGFVGLKRSAKWAGMSHVWQLVCLSGSVYSLQESMPKFGRKTARDWRLLLSANNLKPDTRISSVIVGRLQKQTGAQRFFAVSGRIARGSR